MRSILLAASQNAWLRERAGRYKFVRRSVARFMPGEEAEDAINAAKALAEKELAACYRTWAKTFGTPKKQKMPRGII